MIEAEWLECTDPQKMLKCLRDKGSERKLRLFGVVCVRRIWNLLSEEASHKFLKEAEHFSESLTVSGDVFAASRRIVETVERYGDGSADQHELTDAYGAACEVAWNASDYIGCDALETCVASAAASTAYRDIHRVEHPHEPMPAIDLFDVPSKAVKAAAKAGDGKDHGARKDESSAQAAILRCIFGNPFRSVTLDLSWLTSNVTAIAQAIYDEPAFDRLPILADALEDAGCANQDILEHCRGPGPHVRGCWVVDLLLGKE